MKYASLILLVTLASCGDSKKPAPPSKPATPDVGVAAKPADAPSTEPIAKPPPVAETPKVVEEAHDVAASAVEGSKDGVQKTVDEHATAAKDKLETQEHELAGAKKGDEAPAKTGDAAKSADSTKSADAPAAAPAKVEELSVQVLQEGSGAVVKRGDTVTLEYTISYVPKPEKKDDAKKKDTKGSKKSDAKKSDDKKADDKKATDAKPKDEAPLGDKPTEEKKEPATEEHKDGAVAKTGEKSAEPNADEKAGAAKVAESDSKSADTKSSEAMSGEAHATDSKPAAKKSSEAKSDAKASDAKPTEPLKPVIVASTKSFTTPFTVKLTENGKPKLMPGLVRGVEGLKVGTRARILVPAALAYGKEGNKSAGIPADTTVEIEVFVKDARE